MDKLLDGVNLTCDDTHVWLAPFTWGKENLITIDMKEEKTLSLIRIWNYNKSRSKIYYYKKYYKNNKKNSSFV